MAATAPPAGATNAQLVAWAFEALNAHDVAALRAVWTNETIETFPDATCRGTDEIATYFESVFSALPDLHFEVVKIVADGDTVFARWHITGMHTGGAWHGIEPTGRRIELDGFDHFTVRDGVIVSNFVVFDQMAVGRQMGLLPPDGSPGDRALKAAFNAKTKIAEAIRNARS
jgi:predicted ester cyclase